MKIISIICVVIALFDLVAVGSAMKISSRISKIEETELEKLRARRTDKE